jgi:hypothetical protein
MAVAEPGALPGFFVAPLLRKEFDELNHSRIAGAHERGSGAAGFSIGQIDIDCDRLIGASPSGDASKNLYPFVTLLRNIVPRVGRGVGSAQIGGK